MRKRKKGARFPSIGSSKPARYGIFLDRGGHFPGNPFILPAACPFASKLVTMDTLQTDTSLRRAKILVAEDEAELRLTLCEWLTRRGFAVTGASDGLEALEMASREHFDVVLTDLRMPRCDGLTLLSNLKARDPHVAVVFLSGQATLSDAIEALREGRSFDFLQKPVHDLRRVSDVVERAVQHRIAQGAQRGTSPCWQGLPPDLVPVVEADPVLQTAFRYIEAHFRSAIGLNEVAGATGYNPSYLTHLAKQATGKTIQQWIITYKMTEAQRLLAETAQPVQRIAAILGYADPGSFHRQFRKSFGVPPQSWRQRTRQE